MGKTESRGTKPAQALASSPDAVANGGLPAEAASLETAHLTLGARGLDGGDRRWNECISAALRLVLPQRDLARVLAAYILSSVPNALELARRSEKTARWVETTLKHAERYNYLPDCELAIILSAAQSGNFYQHVRQSFVRLVNHTGSVSEALMCVFASGGERKKIEGIDCQGILSALNSQKCPVTLPGVAAEELQAAREACGAGSAPSPLSELYQELLKKCVEKLGSSEHRFLFVLSALDRHLGEAGDRREAFQRRAEAIRRGPSAAAPWGVLMSLAQDQELNRKIALALNQLFATLPVSDAVKRRVLKHCGSGECGKPVALLELDERVDVLNKFLTGSAPDDNQLSRNFDATRAAVGDFSMQWDNALSPRALLKLLVHVSAHLPRGQQLEDAWRVTREELNNMLEGRSVISAARFGAMLKLAGVQPTPERVSAWCTYYADFLQDHQPDYKPLARFVLTQLRGRSIEADEKGIIEGDDSYLLAKLRKSCKGGSPHIGTVRTVILNGSRALEAEEFAALQNALGFGDGSLGAELLAVLNEPTDFRAIASKCRERISTWQGDVAQVDAILGADADSHYTRPDDVAALVRLREVHQGLRGLTNSERCTVSLSPELFGKFQGLLGTAEKTGGTIGQVMSEIAELYGAGVSISDADILAAFRQREASVRGAKAVSQILEGIAHTRVYGARGSDDLAGYVATAAQFQDPTQAIDVIRKRLAAKCDLGLALGARKGGDRSRTPTVRDLFEAARDLRALKGSYIESLWNLEVWLPQRTSPEATLE